MLLLKKVKVLAAQLCPTVCDPVDCIACQAPPSREFSRLEYRSIPSPGDLPNSGIEPRSPALQVDSLPSEPPEKPIFSNRLAKAKLDVALFLDMLFYTKSWSQKIPLT